MLVTLVPVGGHLTALVDIRAGFPTQTEPGLADVEHQETGLVEGMGIGDVLQLPLAVITGQQGGHLPDGGDALHAGTEVPTLTIFRRFLEHLRG